MKLILHNDRTSEMLQIVNRRHADVEVYCCNKSADLPVLLQQTRAEVLFSVNLVSEPYPAETVVSASHLRWISVGGAGTDHLGQWDPERIVVTNAAGAGAQSIAQYVFAGILSFSFGLPTFAEDKIYKRWRADASVEPVNGKTILIIGLGPTGMEVARIARNLGMNTLGVRANPRPSDNIDEVYPPSKLDALWSRADYIVVCVPLLPATRHLISKDAFEQMQTTAILVDVSRGGIVDQEALKDAVNSKLIAGAVRDVFEPEPLDPDHPLWEVENVLITPHCASVYDGWAKKAINMFCDNLQRYKEGRELENVVNPARGY